MRSDLRAAAVVEARGWIGTPYRHEASLKGVGSDCIGLVRGVWRALYGAEPEALPDYGPDWADMAADEPLLAALGRHMRPANAAAPGDVLAFRMAAGASVRHAAILVAADRIVHAYWGRAVLESRLVPYWRSRIAAAFSFPGAEPWPR